MHRLYLSPNYRGIDKGDGGIRRVVEAQRKYLPELGFTVVDSEASADIVAVHGGSWVDTDKPIVSHCHGLYWQEYTWPNWAHLLNKDVISALNKATATTAPSQWVARSMQRGMGLAPIVLYHGVDLDEWTPQPSEGYVLWNKTRVDPVCDATVVNQLASALPPVRFVTTFGKSTTNVKVTGKLPYLEAKQAVAQADVYLCTSRETFGIGTIEAMACGVPVLGWNWGGQREIVTHKVDGYLATPGNLEDLIAGYNFCVTHRQEMGLAARATIESGFTWAEAMKPYAALYNSLLTEAVRPKVSVVMRCFNLEKYLSMAVDSVLAQTYKDWELIIVDDCSSDATAAIADQYASEHSNIRVVHNPVNVYVSEALNVGVEAARGKYILPVDADNMIPPRTMEVLVSALEADRNINIAYGAMEVINPEGARFISDWPGQFDYFSQLAGRNQCPSTSMYLRSLWERVGGYRQRCRTAEDADFWTRVTSYGGRPKKVTDAVTLQYFLRTDSVSHVNKEPNWAAWYPWPLAKAPFGAPVQRPNVSSYEPVVISVIIPVGLGHEHYLLDALDSLSAQTMDRWEVIVINDSGSPLTRLPSYAIVTETDKPSSGPAIARNKGVGLASAPLLLFLDADDYLASTALEHMLAAYKESGGYIYSDLIRQESGKRIVIQDTVPTDILRKLPHSVTCLVPKAAFDAVGGFDPALEAWEDWDFYIAINAAGYYGTKVDEALFYYRMESGTRRETQYKDRDYHKQAIYNKWSAYIEGEKQFMPCAGCGKKKAATPPTVQKQQQASASASVSASVSEEFVLLEFVPDGIPARTYRGTVTGTQYRFGSDQGHRLKFVFAPDAPALLLRTEFKRVTKTMASVL